MSVGSCFFPRNQIWELSVETSIPSVGTRTWEHGRLERGTGIVLLNADASSKHCIYRWVKDTHPSWQLRHLPAIIFSPKYAKKKLQTELVLCQLCINNVKWHLEKQRFLFFSNLGSHWHLPLILVSPILKMKSIRSSESTKYWTTSSFWKSSSSRHHPRASPGKRILWYECFRKGVRCDDLIVKEAQSLKVIFRAGNDPCWENWPSASSC